MQLDTNFQNLQEYHRMKSPSFVNK